MQFFARAWMIAVPLTAHLNGAETPKELCWVPPEAVLVMSFESGSGASSDLFARFRDELLFATGERASFERLLEASGTEPELVERLLVASLRWEAGQSELGFVLGESGEKVIRSLESATRLERLSVNGRELFLAPGGSASEPELAVARLDRDTLVFGNSLGVLESIELFERGPCSKLAKLENLLKSVDASQPVWAIAHPDWLELDFSPEALESADVAGGSLLRSLSHLQSIGVSAEVSDEEARLTIRTGASDVEEARILADELTSYVASARSFAPDPVQRSLERVEVVRRNTELVFTIPLDGPALSILRGSQTGRNLLRWRLGAEGREQIARVGAIVEALGVASGSRVADIGAGGGFFTLRLARAVGSAGRVYAVDIQASLVDALRARVERAGLGNVEVVLGAPEDPHLPPATLDAVLIVNSYHEMQDFGSMLEHIHRSLKPAGRLVLVEPFDLERRNQPRDLQVQRHQIAPEIIEAEIREKGFELVERVEAFITREGSSDQDSLIVAKRGR